jgi:hypothetical protein
VPVAAAHHAGGGDDHAVLVGRPVPGMERGVRGAAAREEDAGRRDRRDEATVAWTERPDEACCLRRHR